MSPPLPFMILLSVLTQTHALLDINLIENYFTEKSIKSATVFGCFRKTEQLNLVKIFSRGSSPISVLNLNQAGVYQSIKSNHQQIGVVLDGDCPESESFLITCGQLKLFDVKHHWLILSKSIQFLEKIKNAVVNINADIHVAVQSGTNWTIFDVYNPASEHGGSLKYTRVGFYSRGRGYNAQTNEAKYWRRKDMTGVTFKTMVVLLVPFEGPLEDYLHNDDNRNINTFNRFQNKLLRFCRDYYNYSMIVELGSSWGYPFPNGSFDGMVGAMEKKLIDFGSSPIFVREDRARVIDYGRNTWSWKAGFLFRSPKSRTSIEIFLKPLSTSIWLITGVLATASIVILKMVTTFERNRYHSTSETSWSLSFLFTLGALCQQGSPWVPKMACGRITAISIFLLSLIIYQFYSASIVSHLLMKPTNKIRNLKDLTDSSLKVGCEDIIYNKDLFAHTTDKVLKDLYAKKIYGKGNTSHFFPPEKGLDLVRQGGYAFHIEVARAYPIIETTFPDNAICELREVKLFKNTDLYNTMQKGTPFRDMLESCFQRLAEHGLLVRERKHWHPRKPECIQSSKSIRFNVGLDDFYPALVILLVGIVASLLILVIEKEFRILTENPAPPPILVLEAEDAPYPYVD
nr:PREDICTED: glutamate receptor ionotropic, delta-2-like isoform X3 [Tribolium castaneum]|eukprot:XP_015837359.1 PREDICTED: glutamate receptor ionotropic, delta-2-like isoform X3 [Tribolium castaneum]